MILITFLLIFSVTFGVYGLLKTYEKFDQEKYRLLNKLKLYYKQFICKHNYEWINYNSFYHYQIFKCKKCNKETHYYN